MQITIDVEQVATLATDWFSANPWRLMIAYAILTAPFGIRLARSLIRELYADLRTNNGNGFDGAHVPLLFIVAPLLAVSGGISFPFYAVWRLLRAGLGPIPS
jgi:hypothetical protein